ncbi:CU044_2847 family protein [Streptomyces sp. NPDC046915]|uniref:CU044_2847 family protein n=1 Tax=Streptomyces sp. NPDC046915 TaxID=3155257 RepID=UPI0033C6BE1D
MSEQSASQVVSYEVEDGTRVRFEIEPTDEWYQVGTDGHAGRIRDAVAPAVAGARAVLEQVRALQPGQVEVKFGVKVTGTANWLIARAATEANFEITLTWPGAAADVP